MDVQPRDTSVDKSADVTHAGSSLSAMWSGATVDQDHGMAGSVNQHTEIRPQYWPNAYRAHERGWICPACGTAYAPWVRSCHCAVWSFPWPVYKGLTVDDSGVIPLTVGGPATTCGTAAAIPTQQAPIHAINTIS